MRAFSILHWLTCLSIETAPSNIAIDLPLYSTFLLSDFTVLLKHSCSRFYISLLHKYIIVILLGTAACSFL